MKILAIEKERPGATRIDKGEIFRAEADKVWELYLMGLVREVYFHADQHTAVLVLESQSEDEARQVLKTLPLVEAGMIEFEVLPLLPYDGWARLFSR